MGIAGINNRASKGLYRNSSGGTFTFEDLSDNQLLAIQSYWLDKKDRLKPLFAKIEEQLINRKTKEFMNTENTNRPNSIVRNGIDVTLDNRHKTYGDFKTTAKIAQSLKKVMHNTPNWEKLDDIKKEALDSMAFKTARILNGDPEHHDGWHDMEGYIRLVVRELEPTLLSRGTLSRDNKNV